MDWEFNPSFECDLGIAESRFSAVLVEMAARVGVGKLQCII